MSRHTRETFYAALIGATLAAVLVPSEWSIAFMLGVGWCGAVLHLAEWLARD